MATLSKNNKRRNGDVFVTRLANSARPNFVQNDSVTAKGRTEQSQSAVKRDIFGTGQLGSNRTNFLENINSKDDIKTNTNAKAFTKRPKQFLRDSPPNGSVLPRVKTAAADIRLTKDNMLLQDKNSNVKTRTSSGKSGSVKTDEQPMDRRVSSSSSESVGDGKESVTEIRLKNVTINMMTEEDTVSTPVSFPKTRTQMTPREHKNSFDADDFSYSDDEDKPHEVLWDPFGDGTAMVYQSACEQMGIIPSTTFKRCYHLRSAMLSYQGLTPKGIRAICLALVSNATVSELLLAGNSIGNYGLHSLAGMLKHNTVIQVLDVSDNNLGSDGALLLAELLNTTTLNTLKASGNHFKGIDAICFSQALQKNTTLKHLDLSHNEFTEKGGILLGQGIGGNDCLESINLSWNHLRLTGIAGIADGIQANTSIKHLNVSWNGIGNDGARVLGRAIKDNWVLEELDVSSSRIGYEGLGMLFAEMAGNETLKRLVLTQNPITSSGACLTLARILATPNCQIERIEMADLSVTTEFLDLLLEVKKVKPNFVVVYGGILRSKDMILEVLAKTSDIRDPMEILMGFVKQNNLRLMDMFTRLDKDKNCRISREEFERGIKDAEIPLNNLQLDKLISKLDYNGDGDIDFGELVDGYHMYVQRLRKKMRNSAKMQLTSEMRPLSSRLKYMFKKPSSYTPGSNPVTPYCINLSGPLGNMDEIIMSLNHLPSNKNHFLTVSDMNIADVNTTSEDSDSDGFELQVPQLYNNRDIDKLISDC